MLGFCAVRNFGFVYFEAGNNGVWLNLNTLIFMTAELSRHGIKCKLVISVFVHLIL